METESCQPPVAAKSERYVALAVRRDALEAKLQEKNEELKRLCITEAELTGVLPPEIPLEPGEAVPTFRRRIGTSFTLPENLINKLKSEEEQSVSALELEYEIQSHITAAALQLANDGAAKKGLRRQRRFEYQQNHRRLVDLEARLNQVKLNQNAAQKYRKKPRPTVDNGLESGGEAEVTSPGKSSNAGGYIDYPSNTMPNMRSQSHLGGERKGKQQERLHATMSAPISKYKTSPSDSRLHVHRLSSGGYHGNVSPQHQHAMYQHAQLHRLSAQHDRSLTQVPTSSQWAEVEQHYLDKIAHHTEARLTRCSRNRFGSLDRKKHVAMHSAAYVDSRSVEGLEMMNGEDEDVVDNILVSNQGDTISKHNAHLEAIAKHNAQLDALSKHNSHLEVMSKHNAHLETLSKHTGHPVENIGHGNKKTEALLPGQTYPEHSLGHVERNLTRTQSLGSVETPNNANNADTRSIKDMYPSTSYTQHLDPSLIRKLKEKEWYETSLDTNNHNIIKLPLRRPSGSSVGETKVLEHHKNLSNSSCSLHKMHNSPSSSSYSLHRQDSTSLQGSNSSYNIHKQESTSLQGSNSSYNIHKQESTSLQGSNSSYNIHKQESTSLQGSNSSYNMHKQDSTSLQGSNSSYNIHKQDSTSLQGSSSYNIHKQDSTSLQGSSSSYNIHKQDSTLLQSSSTYNLHKPDVTPSYLHHKPPHLDLNSPNTAYSLQRPIQIETLLQSPSYNHHKPLHLESNNLHSPNSIYNHQKPIQIETSHLNSPNNPYNHHKPIQISDTNGPSPVYIHKKPPQAEPSYNVHKTIHIDTGPLQQQSPSYNHHKTESINSPQFNHQQQQQQQNSPVVEHAQLTRAKSEVSTEHFDTVIPFESPKNHMVIEAGKLQPYWEESKPFEMSDFYKYSTKFRKKTGDSGGPVSPQVQPAPISPQQKGMYHPLQPLTCQPLDLQATTPRGPGTKPMSPNTPDNPGNVDSLADAFSSEMLAWYQDHNIAAPSSCSATLV